MLTLISGGARSGKSQLAVELAVRSRKQVVFCATAQALDDEMAVRIAEHKKHRPAEWQLIEEPHKLGDVVSRIESSKLLIIDCLTLYVCNLISQELSDERIESNIRELVKVIRESKLEIIIVTNEVGMGIVPENALARRFRDLAGRANQIVAEVSECVYVCFLGSPLRLK